MKTLADMTEEERAACVGMWCDFPDPDERTNLAIYVGDSTNHHGYCEIVHAGELGTITVPESLTPRYDLPRAWMPDGTPPAGKWVYGEYIDDHEDMTNVYYLNGDGTHRQWKSDWEEI